MVLGDGAKRREGYIQGVPVGHRGRRDRTGTWSLAALVAFRLATRVACTTGPLPPSATAIGVVGLSTCLLVAWTAWADRRREAR
jgi:hypothetical protein